ncbi:MAG: RNA polymerase sigma factor [Microbacterium sp.]
MSGRRDPRDERLASVLEASARDLLRYLERRVGPDDASDALSETMTVAWRRQTSLPVDDGEARLWLFGVARNVVLNVRRGQRRRSALADRLRGAVDPREAAPAPSDVDLDVRLALERIDPDLAELLRLVHWDGFSIAEAAGVLGIPASTARSRYQRAKREVGALLTSEPAS